MVKTWILFVLVGITYPNPIQLKIGLHEGNSIVSHSKEMTGSDVGLFGFQFGFENFFDSTTILAFNGDYVTTQRYPNRIEYSHTAFLSILLRTPKYMVGPIPAERARD